MTTAVHVLHVDDDTTLTDLTAEMLAREAEQLTVETAASASEGLARLADGDVDCIVSDYDMPDMDGIAFLERVRERDPDLPFILYTGKGSEEVAADAIAAGVTDYLQKSTGTDQYAVLANRITNATQSHRSQRELGERNRELQRYRHMVDSMHEAACIYDAEGRFEVVNEFLADWYGTTQTSLEGETSNLIPAVRAEHGDDAYEALLEGERDQLSGELEATFPDHGHAVLEYRLTPLLVDGAVDGVVGVARDVTARKEREGELERDRRAMDEAPVGITITDPDQPDNPLIYVNDHFCALTGYGRDEVLGRNCRFLQGPETAAEAVEVMREAIDTAEPTTVELRNYREDGTEFWNRVSIAPVRDDSGEVRNFIGFQQDVTAEKQRERALQGQNERLEAFSSIVSHDLRNPLSVAQGRVELLQRETESDHLAAITEAHERMDTLITDLLALAQDGESVTDRERTDLGAVARACWANVETGDAELVVDVDRVIHADRSRLRQLFENLIRNAVEHGEGDLTVTVGALDDGFYVADTGAGIPIEDREAVFEAGYTTAEGGTGFGLRIVAEVSEAHGWSVRAVESPAGGAQFEITGVEFVAD